MIDSELRRRIITGAGIGAVIIGTTLAGPLPCYFLSLIIATGSCFEFFRLQQTRSGHHTILMPVFFCVLPLLIFMGFILQQGETMTGKSSSWLICSFSIAFMLYFFTQAKAEIPKLEERLKGFSTSVILFTIPGIFALSIAQLNPKLLLGIFILIWSSDVFAYFGGKAFGKHKLLESVSPKKTWEGFFSGLIAAGLAAWGLSHFITGIGIQHWIVTGLLVVIFGTLGDLLQSVFKRAAGVKDSGTIFPGHGGIWDRFDSFLGCIPWVGMYYILI